ncbi:hypothetical protein A8950_0585 [Dongia mobilis]|uniref:Uncharacterized protein n=1 Tax=Dongia mobilis TaxID=578943 RepID=A0A4R6WUG3_9PROT|nr:hypothetical protein [Dongia mobilis]TDQ84039.1 hypothetical protein A8950_0585 [Dongia mobilis]
MNHWNDLPRRTGADDTADFAAAGHAARGYGPTDLLVVAGFAALVLVAFDDFTAAGMPAATIETAPAPRLEQICSEQELRHMRAGIDACFDEVVPDEGHPGAADRRGDEALSLFAGS